MPVCENCQKQDAARYRFHKKTLCPACGSYYRKHMSHRPKILWSTNKPKKNPETVHGALVQQMFETFKSVSPELGEDYGHIGDRRHSKSPNQVVIVPDQHSSRFEEIRKSNNVPFPRLVANFKMPQDLPSNYMDWTVAEVGTWVSRLPIVTQSAVFKLKKANVNGRRLWQIAASSNRFSMIESDFKTIQIYVWALINTSWRKV